MYIHTISIFSTSFSPTRKKGGVAYEAVHGELRDLFPICVEAAIRDSFETVTTNLIGEIECISIGWDVGEDEESVKGDWKGDNAV